MLKLNPCDHSDHSDLSHKDVSYDWPMLESNHSDMLNVPVPLTLARSSRIQKEEIKGHVSFSIRKIPRQGLKFIRYIVSIFYSPQVIVSSYNYRSLFFPSHPIAFFTPFPKPWPNGFLAILFSQLWLIFSFFPMPQILDFHYGGIPPSIPCFCFCIANHLKT